ncbi:type IV secretion system protein [Mesorhizobium sp. Cs1321R2N1]|uniref:type IV secretion system protein n=1 Tax=Mesorhizobium sp. Cs1321R2N1 TaxID=3015174 RepID=UPI00301D4DBD
MGLISTLAATIDGALVDYVQAVFEGVAHPIRKLLNATALIALLFIAVNHIMQFRPVNYSIYLMWGVRYILIYSFATIWVNFHGIYTILVDVPGEYTALMMRAAASPRAVGGGPNPAKLMNTYSAMDGFSRAIMQIGEDRISNTSVWDIGKSVRNVALGILIMVIGAFFTAASAVCVLISKVGFAVSISLAPLAITMLMMPQTRQHFESWTRFTIGFAIIPLLATALMAVVVGISAHMPRGAGGEFGFPFIMIAVTVLMFMIPTMASTLASASVAAVGAGAAVAAASKVKGGLKSLYKGGRWLEDGLMTANTARAAGASHFGAVRSGANAMQQSAYVRKQRWNDHLARGIIGGSSPKSDGRGAAADGPAGGASRSKGNRGLSPEQANLYR